MSRDIIASLIEVCRCVTADGQLAGEEVWYLANWLNEHPEATKFWPGDSLAVCLTGVFEDQIVTQEELTDVAALLIEIERESSRRPVGIEPGEPQTGFKVQRPLLPSYPIQLEIASSSGGGHYKINLSDSSCNCPDWIDKRSDSPVGSVNRICKHIAKGIATYQRKQGIGVPAWLSALVTDCVERGRGVYPSDEWYVIEVAGKAIVASLGSSDWSNVCAPYGGEYQRFGYNLAERRWSYGDRPYRSKTIAEAIHSLRAH